MNIEQAHEDSILERVKHQWRTALWFIGLELQESEAGLSRACLVDIYRACEEGRLALPAAFWRHVCYGCLRFYLQGPYLQAIQDVGHRMAMSTCVVDMDRMLAASNPDSLSGSLLKGDNTEAYHIQCGFCHSEAIWRFHREVKPDFPAAVKSKSSNLEGFLSFLSKKPK